MQSFRYSRRTMQVDTRIREIYFWLSLACVPLLIAFVFHALAFNLDESPAMRLRLAALGKGQTAGEPYLPFYYVLWLATYLLYLYDNDNKHRIRAIIMGLLVLSFAIATMSKFLILNLGVMTMVVLFHKGVIRFRHLAVGAASLVAVLLVLHAIRQSRNLNGDYSAFLVEQYVLRNLVAFDTLQPFSSEHWGENVFRIFPFLRRELLLEAFPGARFLPVGAISRHADKRVWKQPVDVILVKDERSCHLHWASPSMNRWRQWAGILLIALFRIICRRFFP